MDITNEAKEYIQSILKEQQAEGLRIYAIEGCCGPQIGLSLDSPDESDTVSLINNIQVAISAIAIQHLDNVTLDFETKDEQSGLVMVGAPNQC